jgi:molecular chaperone HscB
MNYFELFGIPVLMKVDASTLREKYLELSKKSTAGHDIETDTSSDLNKAYKIFQHQDETIRYVLQLKGLLHDDEVYELGPDFLTEANEINNQLSGLEVEHDPVQLDDCEARTKNLLNEAYETVQFIIENYQEGTTSEKELLQVKDYYYRKKYLQRVLDRIYQIRNIASHF